MNLVEDFERIRFTVLCRTSDEQAWAAMALLHSSHVCSNKDILTAQPRHVQQGHENMAGAGMKKSKGRVRVRVRVIYIGYVLVYPAEFAHGGFKIRVFMRRNVCVSFNIVA